MRRARLYLETRLYNAAAKHRLLAKAKPLFMAGERFVLWVERGFRSAAPGSGTLRLRVADAPTPGINLVGYLGAELGIGDVARRLLAATSHAGIAVAPIPYHRTASPQPRTTRAQSALTAPYETNVICVNADQLPEFAQAAGTALFAHRYSVGVWFWEVELFPGELHGAFEFVDEVWVASDFVRDALAPATAKPVNLVPVPLDAPTAPPIERSSMGLPDSFVFLFTFDFMSVFDRKNPLGLVAAFKRGFAPGEGAALVLKSINGQRHPEDLQRLRAAVADHPDIYLRDGYLAPERKDALTAACDCYVSLHRSEGLGLTMAEAMSHGKPVIATGYSGNLTFMNDANSYLVPYTLTEVQPGPHPYPPGARWAEPVIEEAALLMRWVWENADEARERGQLASRYIASHHSVDRTVSFIASRLAQIHRRDATPVASSSLTEAKRV
jgi:glycosyltransferase involved in cell wall biosynthesis